MTNLELKKSVEDSIKQMVATDKVEDIDNLVLNIKRDLNSLLLLYPNRKGPIGGLDMDLNVITTFLKSKILSEQSRFNIDDFRLSVAAVLLVFELEY